MRSSVFQGAQHLLGIVKGSFRPFVNHKYWCLPSALGEALGKPFKKEVVMKTVCPGWPKKVFTTSHVPGSVKNCRKIAVLS